VAKTPFSGRQGRETARAALDDDNRVAALDPADRAFLRSAFADLIVQLDTRSFVHRPLHGEPHDGNSVVTPEGIRWIDFEAACVGPVEWDLTFLPNVGVAAFPNVDRDLLGLLRTLNSARVATWCWVQAEMRRHAELHLERVRDQWPTRPAPHITGQWCWRPPTGNESWFFVATFSHRSVR
jgi:hypothetical protein